MENNFENMKKLEEIVKEAGCVKLDFQKFTNLYTDAMIGKETSTFTREELSEIYSSICMLAKDIVDAIDTGSVKKTDIYYNTNNNRVQIVTVDPSGIKDIYVGNISRELEKNLESIGAEKYSNIWVLGSNDAGKLFRYLGIKEERQPKE